MKRILTMSSKAIALIVVLALTGNDLLVDATTVSKSKAGIALVLNSQGPDVQEPVKSALGNGTAGRE